jgi:hypothetical protein
MEHTVKHSLRTLLAVMAADRIGFLQMPLAT